MLRIKTNRQSNMRRQKIFTRPAQPSLCTSLFPQVVAEQVFDNAMVAAGLLDDSRVMLPRLNQLIERLVRAGK